MTFYVLTWINLIGGIVALWCLFQLFIRYVITLRIHFFVFLTMVSMMLLIFTQVYTLTFPAGNWRLKFVGIFWIGKTLYFAWMIRFALIKKK